MCAVPGTKQKIQRAGSKRGVIFAKVVAPATDLGRTAPFDICYYVAKSPNSGIFKK
jgi:hypothetical protein